MEGSAGTSLIKWQHNLAVTSVADARDVISRDASPVKGTLQYKISPLQAELLLSATSQSSGTGWGLKEKMPCRRMHKFHMEAKQRADPQLEHTAWKTHRASKRRLCHSSPDFSEQETCWKGTVLAKHHDRLTSPLNKSVREKQENNPQWCHFSNCTGLR